MGKRVGTAKWYENQKRWQIKVQKDGERRTFTSSTPGRTGQREANAKADEWLDEDVVAPNVRGRPHHTILYINGVINNFIKYSL